MPKSEKSGPPASVYPAERVFPVCGSMTKAEIRVVSVIADVQITGLQRAYGYLHRAADIPHCRYDLIVTNTSLHGPDWHS